MKSVTEKEETTTEKETEEIAGSLLNIINNKPSRKGYYSRISNHNCSLRAEATKAVGLHLSQSSPE